MKSTLSTDHRPSATQAQREADHSLASRWLPLLFFVATFATLLVARSEILYAPPGSDQAGLWVESDWLLTNGFDYDLLRSDTTHGDDGGPRTYVSSVLPTLIALVVHITGSVQSTFLIYRLLNFACSALIVLLVALLLRENLPEPLPWLSGIAVLSTPLFLTQTELLGMEIPMCAAAVLTALMVQRQRFVAAAVISFASFALKNNGIVVTASLIVYLAALSLLNWRGVAIAARGAIIRGFVFSVVVLALELCVLWWGNAVVSRMTTHLTLVPLVFLCSPDLVALAVVAAVHLPAVGMGALRSLQATRPAQSRPSRTSLAWSDSIFNWTSIVLVCLATSSVTYHPRYLTLAVPFVYLELARALGWTTRRYSRKISVIALSAIIAFNLLNHEGAFFPDLPTELATIPTFLERSHEHWSEEQFNRKVVAVLRQHGGGTPVFAPETILRCIATPWLGLVEHPLSGYTAYRQFAYPQFKYIGQLLVDRPPELVVAAAARPFESNQGYLFAGPQPGDDVLLAREVPARNSVYRRRFQARSDGADPHERFIAEQLPAGDVGLYVASGLAASGHPGVMKQFLELHHRGANPAGQALSGHE